MSKSLFEIETRRRLQMRFVCVSKAERCRSLQALLLFSAQIAICFNCQGKVSHTTAVYIIALFQPINSLF